VDRDPGTMAGKRVESRVIISRAGWSSSDPILVNAHLYLDPARGHTASTIAVPLSLFKRH